MSCWKAQFDQGLSCRKRVWYCVSRGAKAEFYLQSITVMAPSSYSSLKCPSIPYLGIWGYFNRREWWRSWTLGRMHWTQITILNDRHLPLKNAIRCTVQSHGSAILVKVPPTSGRNPPLTHEVIWQAEDTHASWKISSVTSPHLQDPF